MDYSVVQTCTSYAILVEMFSVKENSANAWVRYACIETFENYVLYQERLKFYQKENSLFTDNRVFVTDLGKLNSVHEMKLI